MVAGARTDGGNQHYQQQQQQRQTSTQVRKVIQSLKEVVGNHSDADIYAVLKESNMDPNETAQKLLNQDPFHEVKRKRDKKKEIFVMPQLTGYRGFSDARRRVRYNLQSSKPHMTWDRNVQRRDYNRNTLPDAGSNREIRVVREYRVKENAKSEVNPRSVHNSASEEEQAKFNVQDISLVGVLADQKQSATCNSEGLMSIVRQPCDSAVSHTKGVVPTSTCMSLQLGKTQATASTLNSQTRRGQDSSKENSSLTLSNSVVGVYSSASDPVHVPSPASRPAGIVGAIRREVGVVGVRKQSSYQPAKNSAVPNSSFSVPLSAKDLSSTKESFEQSGGTPKQNQVVVSDPVISNGTTSGSFSGSQENIKVTQQSSGHPKAMQSTMEWKPKSSLKPTVISPIVSAPTSSSCAEDASSSNPADVSNLSKKLSQVDVLEERHVIIPQHLQVPESEYTKLTFGSFAAGFDSAKSFSYARQALEDEELCDEPSVSLSASAPVKSIENTSADDQVNMSACQARSSRSESPASAAETEQSPSGNTESLNHQDIENYADIGLVESQSPPYSSPQTQQLPTPASLPTFSAYEPRSSYGVPFFRNVAEDNIHGQGFSSSEALSLHATNNISSSMVALMQPQPQPQSMQQQQQQPVTNLYPQVHFSHFPNFVPYRHVFSPVYVPPMAIPNYSNNPAYPHPSNGSNYFLMPGGSSHIPTGGVKYAPSQYKTMPSGNPTGYGNYTNPTGFTINPPGSVGGATVLEDVNRTRYKDNNLYVPNPQAETSDMWLQTPRELPGLQPASFYNLSGQQPHAAAAAAFMPAAHGGHASFNAAAAQSSHVQYPTLYHPSPSPASLTGPHLVHQSGIGGSIGGVGMVAAAPGSQVGAYQQPQLSHTNWPTNF